MKLTTLCYLEREGCYLMLHRVSKKNDVNKDKWIGVGGKFEPGESPEDCLIHYLLLNFIYLFFFFLLGVVLIF